MAEYFNRLLCILLTLAVLWLNFRFVLINLAAYLEKDSTTAVLVITWITCALCLELKDLGLNRLRGKRT